MIVANVERPGDGDRGSATIRLEGWCFSAGSQIVRIEVRLDGRLVALLQQTLVRLDVVAVHPSAPGRCGFAKTIDLRELSARCHLVRIAIHAADGESWSTERTIYRHAAVTAVIDGSAPRVIAFYLPQYHPIRENDRWWGRGFTEWAKVAPARPSFKGHYQPHIPGELGFYDLRLAESREHQAELAASHGIHGFCYYHYWFNGRRLLERPFNEVLASGSPSLPFCLCFANENWTRRWDGLDSDVLLAQKHSPEDDRAFIRDVIPAFRDERYIRVDGRPLFLLYRPALFPNVRATTEIWREECAQAGVGNPYLAYVQSFSIDDPTLLGFDAAIEFPPLGVPLVPIGSGLHDLSPDFRGTVYDYEELRDLMTRRPTPGYPLFRGVMPSWDNSARRGEAANLFVNSAPEGYAEWLADACAWTVAHHQPEQRLVFVNAWNEWGEGAHLEPDVRFGRLWLEATRDVLERFKSVNVSGPPARPLVSVVVPCYNHERYVSHALESVLDQTLEDLEVIMIDDGSSDGSVAVANRLRYERSDERLRVHAQANCGAHEALNKGLARARGKYVAILNSDDYYASERLETMVGRLAAEQADLAFSRVSYVDGEDHDITLAGGRPSHYLHKQLQQTMFPELVYAMLDFNLTISTGNFVFRRSLYERIGGFKPLLWCHDWDFVLRALRRGRVTFVDRGLYYYRFHGANSFSSYSALGAFEGAFVMEEFFSDRAFVRRLWERDPEYYRSFMDEHDLTRFGGLDFLGQADTAPVAHNGSAHGSSRA